MFGALDALQIKEEGVLQFFAAETHLGATNVDFHIEQFAYRGKSDGFCISSLKRTFRRQLMPLLPPKTPLTSGSSPPGTWASQLCGNYCCARTTPTAGRWFLEASRSRSEQPSGSRDLRGCCSSVAAGPSQRRLLLPADPRCATESALARVDITNRSSGNKGPCSLAGSEAVHAACGCSALVRPVLARTPTGVAGKSRGDAEETEREEQAAAWKAVTEGKFQRE